MKKMEEKRQARTEKLRPAKGAQLKNLQLCIIAGAKRPEQCSHYEKSLLYYMRYVG